MKKLLTTAALFALLGAGCAASTQTDLNVNGNNAGATGTERSAQNNASVTGTENSTIHTEGVPKMSATGTEESGANADVNANIGGVNAGTVVHVAVTINASMQNFAFSPATIAAKKGDKIVFTNKDSVPHTVTADAGAFDSGHLAQGASFTIDTSKLAAGRYTFHCAIHPMMTGSIIIQ